MARSPRYPRVDEGDVAQVIPFEHKMITLRVFIRERGALGKAFATTVTLEEAGRETKCTRENWIERYNAWLTRPR